MQDKEALYEEFLKIRAHAFKEFLLPVVLCDRQLTVRWGNAAAKSLYPGMTEPDGVKSLLAEFDAAAIIEKLEKEGGFVVQGVFGFSPARLNIVPMMNMPPSDSVDGAIVVVVNESAVASREDALLRSKAPIFAEKSVRKNAAALFEALDAASAKADMLDMGWIKPNLDQIAQRGYSMLRGNENFTAYMQLCSDPHDLRVSYIELFTEMRLFAPIAAGIAQNAGLPLRFDLPEDVGAMGGDFAKLALAFLNLLHNALHHTREGNEVVVSGKAEKDSLTVTIADKGAGIAEDILPRVFAPFFAARYSALSAQGLGLTVAKMVVEAHGGTLLLTSKKNVGTTVCLTLPRNLFGVRVQLNQESAAAAFPGDRFSSSYIGLADL